MPKARPLNVLILATDAFGGYGGIAQYNRDFIEALSTHDQIGQIDVMVRLAPNDPGPLPPKVRQSAAIDARALYASNAIRHAFAVRPDLVVSGHLYHGPLAALIANWRRSALISQLHGTEVWTAIAPRRRAPLEQSDLVLCVSRDTRARLLKQTNVSPVAAQVLHNTVGADFTPGDREAARARFDLGDEFVILTVARLDGRDGYKGHDRIIRLLPELAARHTKPVIYLIAGYGEDRARLEALARNCDVAAHVRFLGKVPQEDLPDLYRAADLFALPSTGEGFGIAFIEAMACGTPALGLAVGGAPDALGDGELGYCVSEEDFADAMLAALAAPRPDPKALYAAVQSRFGKPVFGVRARDILAPSVNRAAR